MTLCSPAPTPHRLPSFQACLTKDPAKRPSAEELLQHEWITRHEAGETLPSLAEIQAGAGLQVPALAQEGGSSTLLGRLAGLAGVALGAARIVLGLGASRVAPVGDVVRADNMRPISKQAYVTLGLEAAHGNLPGTRFRG